MTSVDKFFEGDLAKLALADLEERLDTRPELHGTDADGGGSELTLGVLGAPSAGPLDKPVLASLGVEHLDLLRRFTEASSQRRSELARIGQLKLFSIIYANYRPAPAWLTNHLLPPGALTEKINPGGKTWREVLRPNNHTDHEATMAFVARHCARLDRQSKVQAGSGFRLQNGTLLTNRHVIEDPGWFHGQPPGASEYSGTIFYHQLNASPRLPDKGIRSTGFKWFEENFDAAVVHQSSDWQDRLLELGSEFSGLPGLTLADQEPAGLAGCEVAVIGHPSRNNAGGSTQDISTLFADGLPGDKRFLPGTIDADEPMVFFNGHWLINHNCSTLGGASGSCLVDLKTGVVLGLHCAGHAMKGNRAVPAWEVLKKLAKQVALP